MRRDGIGGGPDRDVVYPRGVNPDTDSYQLQELLGRGGSGRVYRALLTTAAGFTREVAVKLLADRDPSASALRRFRDESRALAMIRDRAVVRVESPTKLDGHWALVMEYVPGASCRALLKHRGPLPERAALEIVQEIARALDHLSHHVDEQGRPLQLVHRDIKPANIQITRSGEVRLLDFGIARARLDGRDDPTTNSIPGTQGFVAPERLRGIDRPAGDIYSLGVVLYQLVTGGAATPADMARAEAEATGPRRPVLQLALHMAAPSPDARPTARQVERQCRQLVAWLDGPHLRDWAEANVPHRIGTRDDPLCGRVLSAVPSPSSSAAVAVAQPRSEVGAPLITTLATLNVFVLAFLFTFVFGAGALLWVASTEETGPDVSPTAPMVARTTTWAFHSEPEGAHVIVDGEDAGVTPLVFGLSEGRHDVEMAVADRRSRISVEVLADTPRALAWNSESDGWTNLPARREKAAPEPAPRRRGRVARKPRPVAIAPSEEPSDGPALELEAIDAVDVVNVLEVVEAVPTTASLGGAIADEPPTEPEDPEITDDRDTCGIRCSPTVSADQMRVKYLVQPSYPEEARDMGLGDQRCRVTVGVDEAGTPRIVDVRVCPVVFHDEVEQAIMESRWWPHEADGDGQAVRFTLMLHFRES